MTEPVTPSIRVLIAEDEANLGTILEQFLAARGFAVTIVRNGRAALDALSGGHFDVALLDIVMPEVDGLEVLRQLRELPIPPEVIVITGNSSIDTALAAMKLGAYDFLSKPYRMAEIEALVRRAFEKRLLTRNFRTVEARLSRAEAPMEVDTHFAPMRAVLSLVNRFATTNMAVLIHGAAGTGKSTLARHIHVHSGRGAFPFVAVNAAALKDLAELSELTGSGTLYIENVEKLDPAVQEQLSSSFDSANDATSFRLVAGTERGPQEAGLYLHPPLFDLLSRVQVELPSLAARAVDIPLLAQRILARIHDGETPQLTRGALDALEAYAWPGNIRELQLMLERALMRMTGNVIEPRDLGFEDSDGESMRLEDLERRHIAQVLKQTRWHQGRAAELLGISPKTLYRKIREYGFARPSSRND